MGRRVEASEFGEGFRVQGSGFRSNYVGVAWEFRRALYSD